MDCIHGRSQGRHWLRGQSAVDFFLRDLIDLLLSRLKYVVGFLMFAHAPARQHLLNEQTFKFIAHQVSRRNPRRDAKKYVSLFIHPLPHTDVAQFFEV